MEGEKASFRTRINVVDIHILLVDDDPTSLAVVGAMLRTCKYQVVTVQNPFEALDTLRMKKGLFDLVISDLHMPEMNGLELQKKVQQEFNLPVVMISADEKESVILESLQKGVAFYLVKPVKLDDLKHVWQHAIAAKKGKSNILNLTSSINFGNYMYNTSSNDMISSSSSFSDEGKCNRSKRKAARLCKEKCSHSSKKAKVVWTNALHNRFLHALRQIGIHKAVPKKILDFMSEPGLTRENVASHLQKYRIFLKRVTGDGVCPFQGFSDTASTSSFAPYLPSMVSKNVQPSHKEFSKYHLHMQPSIANLNHPNPDHTLFPSRKVSVHRSLTHLGHDQVLNHQQVVNPHCLDDLFTSISVEPCNVVPNPDMNGSLSVAQSDSLASYPQRPDKFINYPSTHFGSTADSPNFFSSALNISSNKCAGIRMNNGGDNLMISTGSNGFGNTATIQRNQSVLSFPRTNQYSDIFLVQPSPSQSCDWRNEDVFKLDCIDQNRQHVIDDDICGLFMEDHNYKSSFQPKDEEEGLSDLYSIFHGDDLNPSMENALHSGICSSFSSNEDILIQELRQSEENKDVSKGENMHPAPHQSSELNDEEILDPKLHGINGEENGALEINDSHNEGWDEDLLKILFGYSTSEKDLKTQIEEVFNKSDKDFYPEEDKSSFQEMNLLGGLTMRGVLKSSKNFNTFLNGLM